MFIIDSHLDLAWNALQWNRNLQESVYAIREQDRNLSGPGRGHKTPLLGLAKVFDSTYRTDEFWHKDSLQNLKQWQELFWNDIPVPNGFAEDGSNGKFVSLKILGSRRGNIGAGRIRFTHGSFDNSSEHFKDVIEGIRGGSLLKPLTSLNY